MIIHNYSDYKRLIRYDINLDKFTGLTIESDMNKPVNGKLYKMINLEKLSLYCINKKSIDERLFNLTKLSHLIILNSSIVPCVKEKIGQFINLTTLHLDINLDNEIPNSIFSLVNLDDLLIKSEKCLDIPIQINNLSKLKNLAIKTFEEKEYNIGGLYNLDTFSNFDKTNNKYFIYQNSIVIFNYITDIIIPENITHVNILGNLKLINNLPYHINYLKINNSVNIKNLPCSLKELYIRHPPNNINTLKIPFDCQVHLEYKYVDIFSNYNNLLNSSNNLFQII
jgi:hypothetical protein